MAVTVDGPSWMVWLVFVIPVAVGLLCWLLMRRGVQGPRRGSWISRLIQGYAVVMLAFVLWLTIHY